MDEWLSKCCYNHTKEYYSAMKKEWTVDTWNNMVKSMLKVKKPITKVYILFDFIFITFLKWQNYRDEEQGQGTGEGRGKGSVAMKELEDGSMWWWNHSASRLCQCPHLSCDFILQFLRCYHGGHWVKRTLDLSVVFLTTACESKTIWKVF